MLNFDIADHPIYDGFELQWFDDVTHGTGMLAFFTRRAVLRIDDIDLAMGQLPGAWLHRRRLIKYASPVVTIEVLPDSEPAAEVDDQAHQPPRSALRDGVAEAATADGCTVRLEFDPPLPDLTTLTDGAPQRGRWSVSADGTRLTGGRWFAERRADGVRAGLDVTEHWRPSKLPLLIRVVTSVVPVFRRWPTTYEWQAAFGADGRTTAH